MVNVKKNLPNFLSDIVCLPVPIVDLVSLIILIITHLQAYDTNLLSPVLQR